jgi:hypothetical protein
VVAIILSNKNLKNHDLPSTWTFTLQSDSRINISQNFFNTEATERSSIGIGDNSTWGVTLTAYCCIPLRPLQPTAVFPSGPSSPQLHSPQGPPAYCCIPSGPFQHIVVFPSGPSSLLLCSLRAPPAHCCIPLRPLQPTVVFPSGPSSLLLHSLRAPPACASKPKALVSSEGYQCQYLCKQNGYMAGKVA